MKEYLDNSCSCALVPTFSVSGGGSTRSLVDHTGNMFMLYLFCLVGGKRLYATSGKGVPRFGAITTIGLMISLFFSGQAWC